MLLDPVPHELDRHRDFDDATVEILELEALEPARINFLTELCPKHGTNFLATALDRTSCRLNNSRPLRTAHALRLCCLCCLHSDYSRYLRGTPALGVPPNVRRMPKTL